MTALDFENLYNDTLTKLKAGKRPQIKLDSKLIEELNSFFISALKSLNSDLKNLNTTQTTIQKILCVLDNTSNTSYLFKDALLETLKIKWSDQQMYVFALSASQKHVCEDCLKTGNMIAFEFFEILKELLQHSNPEVKEWTLRTITTLGPLSLRLKTEVQKARPSFFQKLNAHQKACDQLIEFLELEWSRMRI